MLEITKEAIKRDIDCFNDRQIKQIADFIAFIKFQTTFSRPTDISQFAHLYQEFAEEDRQLAETGITEYASLLNKEDTQ
jgi:alkyl hydroperoxide reductase subunit AhpC